MISADEARERGLGAPRGCCVVALAALVLLGLLVAVLVLLTHH